MENYYQGSLTTKKNWYSSAAQAYDQVRPHYPEELIRKVGAQAKLSSSSTMLEIGCGPGTATVDFATQGYSLTSLEPNQALARLAQENCQSFPQVRILNTSFEEWPLPEAPFDAVLAATSFHWVDAEVRYRKAAQALHPRGFLILLWNMPLCPSHALHQRFQSAYDTYAPSLATYKSLYDWIEDVRALNEEFSASLCFGDVTQQEISFSVTYSAAEYVSLLSTYSNYLTLAPQDREGLFVVLQKTINQEFDGAIELQGLAVSQTAQKTAGKPL